MLSDQEHENAAVLSDAIQRQDRVALKAIVDTLEAAEEKTLFARLMLAKALIALGPPHAADIAEYEARLSISAAHVENLSRDPAELNREKRDALEAGVVFDFEREGRLLECLRQVCELAAIDVAAETVSLQFRMKSLSFAASLLEELELYASNLDALLNERKLCDLIVKNYHIAAGTAEAAILFKYASAMATDESDRDKIALWRKRNQTSEKFA